MSCEASWNVIDMVGGCAAAALGWGAEAVGDMAVGIVESVIGLIAQALGEAVGWVIENLGTFWVNVPTFSSALSDDPSSAVGFMWAHLHWYIGALLLFAVLFAAGKIIITQRSQPVVEILRTLMVFALIVGAGLPTIVALSESADLFSSWIIDEATDDDFTSGLAGIIKYDVMATGGLGTLIVTIIGGILAILASIVQIMLLFMRSAMIVLLAAVLPLSASFTNTEMGQQWFKRAVAWLLAFILYKPVASIIYALAFRMVSGNSGGNAFMGLLIGITMMVLSLLALPALMRFMVPAVSHTAGGAGFGAVMGAVVAGGGAIVGARMMMSGSSGSGTSGPTGAAPSAGGRGQAGPSGPTGGSGPAGGGGAAGKSGSAGAAGSAAGAAGGAATAGALTAVQIAREQTGKALAKPGEMASQTTGENPNG